MMAPSSSGLGRLVLIQKIAGSTPAGVTIKWNLWASYGVITKLKEFGGIKEDTFDKCLFDKNFVV